MTPEEIDQLIGKKVAAAISAYAAVQTNGEGSKSEGSQGMTTQGCSYEEFMRCKPLDFSGDEGTIGLVRWFEKLELIFHNSECTDNNRVKFATCTLLGDALTWWGKYRQSVGVDAAYETTWEDFRQMIIEEYCPRNEIRKLEAELLKLRMKGTDVVSYTRRFQELALLCPAVVTSEYKRIELYIQGLSPQIQDDVASLNPKTNQAAIFTAYKLMDQIILQEAMAENEEGRQYENQGKNTAQHQNKKQKMGETGDASRNVKRGYTGKLPYCGSCDKHHTGHCTNICNKCKRYGHMAKDCKVAAPKPITAVPMTCYDCGEVGHYKKNCPKLKKQTLKRPKEEPI